jgi:8-oxo-dGTP diphosphatase
MAQNVFLRDEVVQFKPCPGPAGLSDANHPAIWVVAAALMDVDGRVLMAQRPQGKSMAGLWEFPGGKIEPGEKPECALVRELHEELRVTTSPTCLSPAGFCSHIYDKFQLVMLLYACRNWAGPIVPQEDQAVRWVRPEALADLPMPPADYPLAAQLRLLL